MHTKTQDAMFTHILKAWIPMQPIPKHLDTPPPPKCEKFSGHKLVLLRQWSQFYVHVIRFMAY